MRCSRRLREKVQRRGAALVRRRRRALPAPRRRRRRAARQRGARAPARRPHVLQPQHAHRGHQRLRRVVPLLLVREARGGGAGRAHDDARRGVARARGAHGRPAERDPHRQRPAPRACRSRTTRSSCAGFKRIKPDVHMKCFTAVEIHFFAQHYGMTYERGARAPARARGSTACPAAARRSSTPRCARASRTTRRRPTSTSRCTASPTRLGHAHERDDALRAHRDVRAPRRPPAAAARAAGRDARACQAFIPLAFHPDGNGMRNLPAPTAIDALRTVAVSRLLLDNVPHIKAYWVSMTPEVAQIALRFGADDVDGTIVHETIYRAAGSRSPSGAHRRAARAAHPGGRPHPGRARHALQRRARAPARRAARGRAQGARPQGGTSTWRCCRERRPASASASPRSGTSTRARSTRGSIASRPARASSSTCASPQRGRAPHRRGRGRRRAHARRRGGHDRRPAPRARVRHRRARGRSGASSSSPTGPSRRSRSSRSICRRGRASSSRVSCCAPRHRGREPRLVGAEPARGDRPRRRVARRARHRRPGARDRGALPARRSTSAWRGGSSPGCRSSSRPGAGARARSPRTTSACSSARRPRASTAATRSPTSTRRARGLPPASLRAYLRDAIRYDLGDDERRGLERFYDEAARAGLLPRTRVRFFDDDRRAPGAEARRSTRSSRRAADGERLSAAEGERLLAEASLFDLGLAADAVRAAQAPARRRHVHRRPQRQLHQRLHDELPLLRLLPPARAPRGLRPLARGARRRSCRRSSTRAACRSSCRAACTPSSASSGTRTSSAG